MATFLSFRFRKNLIDTGNELLFIPDELRRRTVNRMTEEADAIIKDSIAEHTKTGVLASSYFNKQTPSKRGRTVGHDLDIAPYAKWLIEGSRPHTIAAKNADALHFYWPKVGKWVFFKSVRHPGYVGDDYIRKGYDAALAKFSDILNTINIRDL